MNRTLLTEMDGKFKNEYFSFLTNLEERRKQINTQIQSLLKKKSFKKWKITQILKCGQKTQRQFFP